MGQSSKWTILNLSILSVVTKNHFPIIFRDVLQAKCFPFTFMYSFLKLDLMTWLSYDLCIHTLQIIFEIAFDMFLNNFHANCHWDLHV